MKNTRRIKYFPLEGGEDLITPLYSRPPGLLVVSQNFECDPGGRYRRIAGYERYDGRPSPSEASYWVLYFDAGTVEVSAGDTVTGGTSSATGIAVIDGVLESGSYAGSDAAGYLVLREVSGTFQDDEDLEVSASATCVANGVATERGAPSPTLDTTYIRAAVADARDDIAAVPGSGNVLGVWMYKGTLYAFRNNAGGTATDMYKSSTAGWTKVALGSWISFDAGTAAFTVGETLTGGTSGATAAIRRVVVTSGTWAGSDAAGYVVLGTITGGPYQNNETITSAGGSATADGASAAIALTIGGRYEFVNHNFYGHSDYYRMYGCDGKNYAFEFDGTTYVPIKTGMTTDTPDHIAAFKLHLMLSFKGGSVQNSSTGEPIEWSAVTGASELGIGQDTTALCVTVGGTLGIFGRNGISILSGTGSSDWVLSEYSTEIGAIEWSVQKLGSPIFLDDNGLTSLDAVTAYGDFKANSLSQNIQTFFTEAKKTAVVASMRVKAKEQYRLFFSDDTGLNLTFNGSKVVGFTRLRYPDSVTCTCSGEDTNGNEVLFFGSDDGMVYELDKGTSFDGDAITAYFKTSLATLGSPENTKRFFKLVIERDNLQEEGEWGVGTWGNFYWGEQGEERDESYLDETGTGYDYLYYSSSAYLESFVMQGIIIHYSVGGLKR